MRFVEAPICCAVAGAFMSGQFDNPANPDIHARTTAHEILRATDGLTIGAFVAGAIVPRACRERLLAHDSEYRLAILRRRRASRRGGHGRGEHADERESRSHSHVGARPALLAKAPGKLKASSVIET